MYAYDYCLYLNAIQWYVEWMRGDGLTVRVAGDTFLWNSINFGNLKNWFVKRLRAFNWIWTNVLLAALFINVNNKISIINHVCSACFLCVCVLAFFHFIFGGGAIYTVKPNRHFNHENARRKIYIHFTNTVLYWFCQVFLLTERIFSLPL